MISSADVFDGFWQTHEDANLLLNARLNQKTPYCLVSVGTLTTENKTKRVFAARIEEDLMFNLSNISLPGVATNHSVKWNIRRSAECVGDLLSREQHNVLVDTVKLKLFTNNRSILEMFIEKGLDKRFQIGLVDKFNQKKQWERVLKTCLEKPVKTELKNYSQ